ncbi:hypothetical protein AtNW77_Chr4g0307651 [Arabidopsis thaliana]|uniref:Uncharacterized protein n=3 Tax=Arabidopsis TaxID=3701 RepID=B3H6E1_ARATH|nr:uncharacterized protein AT4G29548 [Arabidopsis thaliana]AEE85643.1 hypothetical protein AT4G29548 [Arabidopsis thaliana]KAG7617792.1 hypothetical protein ISN45_At04g031260 [Arabidopsis thaliana x Arabidopsis arenosa]CAA0396921.1 unnamed protein product [Arabidopsis thaliana]|eukprot:NP_001119078.1 hypothetical protein AT4G29548 [Arabidopsis thaliana]
MYFHSALLGSFGFGPIVKLDNDIPAYFVAGYCLLGHRSTVTSFIFSQIFVFPLSLHSVYRKPETIANVCNS